MQESPVSLESEFSRWHILTYSTFKPRRWVLFLLFYNSSCSLLHTGNKLGLWSDGMEERSNRKRAGRPEDVSQCRSRWGEQRKDRRVERRRFVSSHFFFFFFLHKDGDTGRLSAVSSLSNLHVVGREKAVSASAHASPPTLVDHLDVGDDVIGVEGYLVVAGWNVKTKRWRRSTRYL